MPVIVLKSKKMENIVNKVKALQEMYCKIRRLFNVSIPLWLSKPKEYDKVSVEFRKGDSNGFTPGNEIQIHFAAWLGSFGSSDVYAQLQMDKELWQEYFLMYLNVHKKI